MCIHMHTAITYFRQSWKPSRSILGAFGKSIHVVCLPVNWRRAAPPLWKRAYSFALTISNSSMDHAAPASPGTYGAPFVGCHTIATAIVHHVNNFLKIGTKAKSRTWENQKGWIRKLLDKSSECLLLQIFYILYFLHIFPFTCTYENYVRN